MLAALAEGLTNRELADRLFISERTANRHLSNIFVKLGVRNRTARRGSRMTPASPDGTRLRGSLHQRMERRADAVRLAVGGQWAACTPPQRPHCPDPPA